MTFHFGAAFINLNFGKTISVMKKYAIVFCSEAVFVFVLGTKPGQHSLIEYGGNASSVTGRFKTSHSERLCSYQVS